MSMEIHTFETIVILHEKLSKEEVKLWAEYFKETILKPTPAAAIGTEYMGRKRLGYKTRNCNYGWYVIFRYRCTSDLIHTILTPAMQRDDTIIKFLTTNFDEEYIPDELTEQKRHTPVDVFNLIFQIEDQNTLRLYSISADGGESWTEQWITEAEALDLAKKYNVKRKE